MTYLLSLLVALLLHFAFFFFFNSDFVAEDLDPTPASLEVTSVTLSFGDSESSDKRGEDAEKHDPFQVQTERKEISGSVGPVPQLPASTPHAAPPAFPDLDAVPVVSVPIREAHELFFSESEEIAKDQGKESEPDWTKQWELKPEYLPEVRVIAEVLPDFKQASASLHSSMVAESSAAGAIQTTLIAKAPIHPDYPMESRRRNEEGSVTLSVRVSAEGKPISVQLNKSSGFKRLDQAAIKAVHRARFHPAVQRKKAVDSELLLTFEFRLSKESPNRKK